ncbi:class I adenylate-forming enzyme family protein [Bosea sp. NPDC055594]
MTDAPFSRTLFDLLREQAGRRGAHPAVIADESVISYAEMAGRAARVASALARNGVRRGDRVGLLISNRTEWLELSFGASAVGATIVPFSTWSTRQELAFLLADSGVRILFALPRFGDRDFLADLTVLREATEIASLRQMVILADEVPQGFTAYRGFLAENGPEAGLPPGLGASAIDDALILYTSGSSSHPKAVRLRHHGIIENGFNIGERQGLRAEDRVLLSSPLFWAYGGSNALPATFTHGATLVLQEKFDAAEAIALIERHRCTAIYTLPAMTSAMLLDPSFSPERTASLRTGVTIGSPKDIVDAATRLGAAEICNIYGATETYGNCCVTWHHWPLERRARCQGTPLPGVEMRFVDPETGAAVAQGEAGLAEVRGYVTPGYSGASASQNEAILTADGFYRTGDMGQLDEGGAFVFVGRDTEMIKKAGINISPAEIEEVLLRHPAVRQTCVVGVPDARRGEIVVAFVVPEGPVSAEELTAHCREMSSKYKVPDRIELCEALPLTATGKVMRRALKGDAVALVERAG